jgi:hypothetical protein
VDAHPNIDQKQSVFACPTTNLEDGIETPVREHLEHDLLIEIARQISICIVCL